MLPTDETGLLGDLTGETDRCTGLTEETGLLGDLTGETGLLGDLTGETDRCTGDLTGETGLLGDLTGETDRCTDDLTGETELLGDLTGLLGDLAEGIPTGGIVARGMLSTLTEWGICLEGTTSALLPMCLLEVAISDEVSSRLLAISRSLTPSVAPPSLTN